MKTIGYIRVSTEQQTTENQKNEILKYTNDKKILVDEFIDIEISSRKSLTDRKINLLIKNLETGDNLIVSELSRIGRSTKEILEILEVIINNGIKVHIIKQNLVVDSNNKDDMNSKIMITIFSLFAELERDLVRNRTKSALAGLKAKGIRLGKPKGTLQKTQFDKDRDKILELLNLGVSINKIAKTHILVKPQTLTKFINKTCEVFEAKNNLLGRKIYKFNKKYIEFLEKNY